MFKNNFITKRRRQREEVKKHIMLVERIRRVINMGHSDKEVAELLCLPESTVRTVREAMEKVNEE